MNRAVKCEKASLCLYAKLPGYRCEHGKEHEEDHLCSTPCLVFRDRARNEAACVPIPPVFNRFLAILIKVFKRCFKQRMLSPYTAGISSPAGRRIVKDELNSPAW